MQSTKAPPTSKTKLKNPFEALTSIGQGVQKGALDSARGIGGGVMDSFLGGAYDDDFDLWDEEMSPHLRNPEKKHEAAPKPKKEHKEVFKFAEHHEKVEVQKQIKELLTAIHQEIKALESQGNALLADVKDIESAAINELPEDPGIYHVRFFEVLLSIVRSLREKVGESATWLEAMMSKKKKRGSLFAARSKNQGTQYSLSQELQVTRSVQ